MLRKRHLEPGTIKSARLQLIALFAFTIPLAHAAEDDRQRRCKPVRADLVEVASTVGCKPGHKSCFLGTVDGDNGLDGTAYFRADSVGKPAPGSPDSVPYSGPFEYKLAQGNLLMHETGVTVPGAVTAYQKIVEGTGKYAGVTGYFFVSGRRGGGTVITKITGEICYPDKALAAPKM